MSLTKAQLVFDSTTAANGDAVAAYLFATNRLTSTAVNGNESLHTIAALQDGAGTALTSTLVGAKQSLDVNVASFTATDLHVDGTVADGVADANNPVKIGSRAFSGALSAIGAAGERADGLSDMYRRIMVTVAPQVSVKVQTATVGITAAKLLAAENAGRTWISLQNNGSQPIYIGADNTVTADTAATGGLQVPAHGGTLEMPLGDALSLWAISGTAGQKVAVLERG